MVSMLAEVSTTFLGMLVMRTGTSSSFSYVSLSVMMSQMTADRSKKNRNTKNCLFMMLNKKSLILLNTSLIFYFCIGVLVVSLKT